MSLTHGFIRGNTEIQTYQLKAVLAQFSPPLVPHFAGQALAFGKKKIVTKQTPVIANNLMGLKPEII